MAGSAVKSRVRKARPDAALIVPRARNEDPFPDGARSVGPNQTHQPALNFNLIIAENPGFISRVRSFKRYCAAFSAEPFQGCLMIIHERHNDVAVFGRAAFTDDHDVTVVDSGIDH